MLELQKLAISRCVKHSYEKTITVELHHFADSSSLAYGSVSYLRTLDTKEKVYCNFMMGKGYIAREKRTVPQLELLADVTAERLDQSIRREMTIPINRSYFWWDSTATLQSILSTQKHFSVFTANRLAEIEQLTRKIDWRFVPTTINSADDVTKGLSVKRFLENSSWLDGPEFLWGSPTQEPEQPVAMQLSQNKHGTSIEKQPNVLPVIFPDTNATM